MDKIRRDVIDRDLVGKLARMTLIDLGEDELQEMLNSLNKIIEWFEALKNVDTSNIDPLYHPLEDTGVLRDDEQGETMREEDIRLLNKPIKDGYVVAPWRGT